MQPSSSPRRLHELGLQIFIRQNTLDQGVAECVAFGVGCRCPVEMKERHLAFRVAHRFSVDKERRDLHRPFFVFSAASGFDVLHAPRFDGSDYPLIVLAASFATDVFQHALVNANVVMALLALSLCRAGGSSCGDCSALGCLITTKDGDKTGAFDESDHIFGRRRTPEEGAPDPQ